MPLPNSTKKSSQQGLLYLLIGIVGLMLFIFFLTTQFFLPCIQNSWTQQTFSKLTESGYQLLKTPSAIFRQEEISPTETVLVVTGDVLLAREVNALATAKKDFLWPWRETVQTLQEADITLVNLETPLVDNCPITHTGMIFCGDPQHVTGLVWAGVDVASLANNHALNQGVDGVEETKTLLQQGGVQPAGLLDPPTQTQTPVILERNGIRFAFLAYTDLGATAKIIAKSEPEILKHDISEAKKVADVVIPFFHWGEEYQSHPTARQTLLAHTAVEAGADLVIGNHAHWYQSLETYQGVPIVYSHGNFIFDQMWSEETRLGLVGRYTFSATKLIKTEFLPIKIEAYGQPHFLEGEEKVIELKKFEAINQANLQP